MRKDINDFVENDVYVIMYSGTEINIYPKGSVYRTLEGVMQDSSGSDQQILGKVFRII